MSYETLFAIERLASFIFICIFLTGFRLGRDYPIAVRTTSIFMVVVGLALVLFGFLVTEKYKNIFDYEPTMFWGKESNGKTARGILRAFGIIGFCSFFTGVILLVLLIRI